MRTTPTLLAIDTSTEGCSVALMRQGEIKTLAQIAPRQHSQLILPMIKQLLAESAITLADCDALAFACGPGGFTGIRIGASLIQGLAFSHNLPVVPISTLQALSQNAYHDHQQSHVLAALDAQMHEIYWSAYELNSEQIMLPIIADKLISPQEVTAANGKNWFGAGNAWKIYGDILKQKLADQIIAFDPEQIPHAREVVKLANYYFLQGKFVSAEQALPVYLRGQESWRKMKANNEIK